MTRTLPWLKGGASTTSSRPVNASSSTTTPLRQHAAKRRRLSTPPPDDDEPDLNTTGLATPSRRRLMRGDRTPSTSPPPAPPDELRMREGLAADDIWIMVEDEFYSTAQAYTTHLHHAEYQRLKKLASEREKAITADGTDGKSKMSADGAMSLLRERRDKSVTGIMKKLAKPAEEASDEDDPWVGTQLAGLMDSPRKAQKLRAKSMGVGRSNTRAAKGFGRSDVRQGRQVSFDGEIGPVSPTRARHDRQQARDVHREHKDTSEEDDADEDDLDAPARVKTNIKRQTHEAEPRSGLSRAPERERTVQAHEPRSNVASMQQLRKEAPSQRSKVTALASTTARTERSKDSSPPRSILRNRSTAKTTTTSSMRNSASRLDATTRSEDGHDYGFTSIVPPSPSSGGGFLARRKAEREREKLQKEQEERRRNGSISNTTAEVPTFLF